MPTSTYNWVPDDLVEVADEIAVWLVARGYTCKLEPQPVGFPFPPTLLGTRGKLERILVEVLPTWQEGRLQTWIAYAKTCPKELKIYIGLAHSETLSNASLIKIRSLGVGIIRAGGGNTFFEIEAADASINVSLPPRNKLEQQSRQLLGPAYDHFEASRWREGFEDACKVFETNAKRYLKKWVRTGRIRFVTARGIVTVPESRIDRFTMGQLGMQFVAIQAQNSSDAIIARAIKTVLKDRNNLTHKKWSMITEKRLRANVGQHMWVIAQALSETYK